jgi:hypothetical protein
MHPRLFTLQVPRQSRRCTTQPSCLEMCRLRVCAKPERARFIPKGVATPKNASRVGNSQIAELVLTNQKYLHPPNPSPIPFPIRPNQHKGMGRALQFRQLAAALLLAACFGSTPSHGDTHFYNGLSQPTELCRCGCESGSRASASVSTCTVQRCKSDRPGPFCESINQRPTSPNSSDRPLRSRPAYSRKSNRIQRA